MATQKDDSGDSIEQAAERAFENLADSNQGGRVPDGGVPSDPNDDGEVPAHSSVSEGLNSTSADPIVEEDKEK